MRFPIDDEQWNELKNRYIAGELGKKLASEYGIYYRTIYKRLRKEGVTLQTKSYAVRTQRDHYLNEKAFDEITPESAYWLGFLLSDGNVHDNNSVQINLARVDRGHLVKFKNFLGASNAIYDGVMPPNKSRGRTEYSKFTVRSPILATSLAKFGIVPRKSLTAYVVDELKNDVDFWRGVVDGDGCLSINHNKAYKRKDGPGFYRPRTGISIALYGSELVVKAFEAYVKRIIKGTKANTRQHGSIFEFKVVGEQIKSLVAHLYKDASVVLDRKALKAEEILNTTIGIQK